MSKESRQHFSAGGGQYAHTRYALLERPSAGFELGQPASADGRLLHHFLNGIQIEPANDGAFGVLYSGNIGEIDERVGAAGYRAGRGHLVGIHVVVLAVEAQREAGDHRNNSGAPQALDPLAIHRADLAHVAKIGLLLLSGAEDAQVAAADADGRLASVADGRHQLLIELPSQHHHGDVAGLRISDPQSVDERALAAELLQGATQGCAAAVDDYQLMALAAQIRNGLGELADQLFVVECGSSDFHHEFHCSPSFSSKPNMRFMFCTACPAAPFRRLSRHETSTARWPSGESAKPM